jgi:hypothetical protein
MKLIEAAFSNRADYTKRTSINLIGVGNNGAQNKSYNVYDPGKFHIFAIV